MNNLDMYSREMVNKINLDEMHRDAKIRLVLRDAKQERNPKIIAVNGWRYIALPASALMAAIIFFIRRI